MSILAVVVILLFSLILGATVYVAINNTETLLNPIYFWGDQQLSVWAVIVGAFFVGFTLAFALAAIRSSKQAIGRMREARGARQRQQIDLVYAEGLQAVVAENPARAEERFREALARNPDHADTLMAYGELLRASGRVDEAVELHRRAVAIRPGDMAPLFALAADFRSDQDVEKARETLERIIEEKPRQATRARRELRDLLVAAERWEEARREQSELESALGEEEARERERWVGYGIAYEIGRAAQLAGSLKEAEREYRALLKQKPDFVPAILALGEVLIAAGQAKEAVREWRRGFELSESPVFLTRLEEFYLSREKPEELVGVVHALAAKARAKAVPTLFLGKLYLRLEMIDEAESTFGSIEADSRDAPLLRYYGAKILERRGRHREAAQAYRAVIKDSGPLDLRFQCRECAAEPPAWSARCERCRSWGRIDVDTRNTLGLKASGPPPRPEWAAGA